MYRSHCYDKVPKRSSLRGERFILVHDFRCISVPGVVHGRRNILIKTPYMVTEQEPKNSRNASE